jgi:hypothetical protein
MRYSTYGYLLAAAFSLMIVGDARADLRWSPASNGSVPGGAVSGGHEAGGEALYVCRAQYNGGTHGGKIRSAFGGCNIGWGGKEVTISSYDVLIDVRPHWAAAQGGAILPNAVPAGSENGQTLYICRARFENGIHSGKIRQDFHGCNIGYGGREHTVNPYELLLPY